MKTKICLSIILILSTCLRFINLGKIPNSYTPDELAQGYTAYSIISTGKDEWNNSNWLNLRSFGDFKPPVQTLLMIPGIKIFGLNTFSVRFPNALFSILTILFTYLLANLLFKDTSIALLSSLLMAISPWFLPMSRIALEANLVIFFITSATYFFLLARRDNLSILFIIPAIIFALSFYTYHSAKLFLFPYLILLFFYTSIIKHPRHFLTFTSIFILLILIPLFLNHQAQNVRTTDIAIFNPTDRWQEVSDNQYEITNNGLPYLITKLFNNKFTYLYRLFIGNYLSYFSPQFLLTNGAGETTYGMLPGYGVVGIIPGLGIIFFLIFLLKNFPKISFSHLFLLLSVIIAPLPAAISKGQFAANRASLMMPFIQIIASAGIIYFLNFIPSKFKKISTIAIFSALTIFSLSYLQKYFFQANQILAKGMLYGHQQINQYLSLYPNSQIIYSRKLSEPQAYATFFNQINPRDVQNASNDWIKYQLNNLSFLDQLSEYYLNNYTFREINIKSDQELTNTILVGKPEEFLDTHPDYVIYYPSFSHPEPAIYIYHTKK